MARPLIIPFFLPHAGCPFTCVFCNQWEISGTGEIIRPEDIRAQVLEYLHAHKGKCTRTEVAFYGGSFTGIEQELQQKYLEAAYALKQEGLIQGIRLSTRPDYIDRNNLENLLAYGVTTVELGIQSLADEVLTMSQRGYTAECVARAAGIIREYPLEMIFQLMLGLPGDNPDRARYTAAQTIRLKPDGVRIYPAVIMKGTTLEKWYRAGLYQPWSLEEAVTIGTEWLLAFNAYGIKVIRLGLQAADNLTNEADLVAGPYHPAYGELVQSRLLLAQLRSLINKFFIETGTEDGLLSIYCHPRDLSKVAGQKRSNLRILSETYSNAKIVLETDPALQREELRVAFGQKSSSLSRQDFLEEYRISSKDVRL